MDFSLYWDNDDTKEKIQLNKQINLLNEQVATLQNEINQLKNNVYKTNNIPKCNIPIKYTSIFNKKFFDFPSYTEFPEATFFSLMHMRNIRYVEINDEIIINEYDNNKKTNDIMNDLMMKEFLFSANSRTIHNMFYQNKINKIIYYADEGDEFKNENQYCVILTKNLENVSLQILCTPEYAKKYKFRKADDKFSHIIIK